MEKRKNNKLQRPISNLDFKQANTRSGGIHLLHPLLMFHETVTISKQVIRNIQFNP